ncbi:hypothetical protein NO995_05275 [Aestuariibaculum sp. M13]|uniref:hypothetical protein n=1 Tax=Aestuariibaculum sp. M13 TaxID=2967132 RepID=UPI002159EF67|nr:hypothetical protein [Aestuariibaculum sp. M13]MCR8667083.1 hypothetical protein [Aestuariibaculum sp. M13]
MNRNELAELLKYASPYSILVVTYLNKIIELKTPFRVQLKTDVGELRTGDIVEVELIKLSTNLKTVFVIQGEAYYYFHFNILID